MRAAAITFHGETENRTAVAHGLPAQSWAVALLGWLNRQLRTEGYRACTDLFLESGARGTIRDDELSGYPISIPAVFPDRFEVLVHEPGTTPHPVGIVSLVTPRAKLDPRQRAAFVRCCVAHLHHGTGVVLIDIVTDGLASIHNEILDMIAPPEALRPADMRICVVSYSPRPARFNGANAIDIWAHPASIGHALPTVPFVLADRRTLFLDLEATYTAAIEATGL